ncbi:MAG TPA: LysM peptidoglycan-binding domain-containing protein [Bacteroidota bacterium]|nr:LysM peptidoglycan-binding domain-containing protein [Bacteroidota bacterium]
MIKRTSLVAMLMMVVASGAVAQELSKEEWQKQVTEQTAKRNDLRNKLTAVQTEVDNLKKQDADKAAVLKNCQDELMAMVGGTEEQRKAYSDKMARVENWINELSRLSNQDLWARKGEIDEIQKLIDELKKDKLSAVPDNYNRVQNAQNRLDALKRTIAQLTESGQMGMTYTVGTWARDRDCLWNIAKKPRIYDNAFLWPKIWQGNRDQIKNPDIIHPGQKLKIPPKAPLTNEEKAAVRSYWQKKNAP